MKLRGVNMGGWLVLERWITPSLFEGTTAQDEFTFMQEQGAARKIEQHRREFITEADFQWLDVQGINAVRIPVGYWIFDGDGPFMPCIERLDWAVEMAEKYGLKVLLDLHAVNGSQNGNDHSGRVGRADWYRNSAHRQETIDILLQLATRYQHSPAIWGIELLNEPSLNPIKYFMLKRFYERAYQELAAVARPGTCIVFSDAFMPRLFSGALKYRENYPSVMDIHWYQFGRTKLEKYFSALPKRKSEIKRLQRQQPVIIGEWSGMLSHKTLAGLPEYEKVRLQKEHIRRQLDVYESAAGWFYWTYKTESKGIWNFREQVENGSLLL